MSFFENNPNTSIIRTPEKNKDVLTHSTIKTNLLNTKKIPLANIIPHSSGAPWAVNYYFSVLGRDDSPTPIDLDSATVTNQLRLVKGQEIRVQDPLSYNPLEETRETDVRGSSNIYSQYKPNIGDVFIAGVREGYEGIFSVTNVETLSPFRESLYRIDYVLYDYVDRNEPLYNAIEDAVIERMTYVEEKGGYRDVILDEDLSKLVSLREYYQYYTANYCERFLNRENNILELPDHDSSYDMFIVDFFFRTTNQSDSPLFKEVHLLDIGGGADESIETILDAILKRSVILYKKCYKDIGLLPSQSFKTTYVAIDAHINGISKVTYPLSKIGLDETLADAINNDAEVEEAESGINFYKPCRGGKYIFSEFFYTGDIANMSKLESIVLSFIKQESISPEEVLELAGDLLDKDDFYIFYYSPIICLLIKVLINRL